MSVCEKLIGKYVYLETANEEDAMFTVSIRNDDRLTKYIPKVSSTVENQKKWILKQRQCLFDVFFVIKNVNGQSLGTLSYYDNDGDNCCEIGRYISYGNAFENIEAVLLILDELFSNNSIDKVRLNIHKDNKSVISLWTRFGAVYKQQNDMGKWISEEFCLSKEAFFNSRTNIVKLLRY